MARPHKVAVPAAVAAPLPCGPVLAAASLGSPVGGVGGIQPFDLGVAQPETSGFTPVRGFGPPSIGRSSFGSVPAGDGGPGGVGGPGNGNPTPGGGNTIPDVPSSSNAPEPTTWVLMIGGFGMLGGAMRYARVARTA